MKSLPQERDSGFGIMIVDDAEHRSNNRYMTILVKGKVNFSSYILAWMPKPPALTATTVIERSRSGRMRQTLCTRNFHSISSPITRGRA